MLCTWMVTCCFPQLYLKWKYVVKTYQNKKALVQMGSSCKSCVVLSPVAHSFVWFVVALAHVFVTCPLFLVKLNVFVCDLTHWYKPMYSWNMLYSLCNEMSLNRSNWCGTQQDPRGWKRPRPPTQGGTPLWVSLEERVNLPYIWYMGQNYVN